jgi:hypothetical protein
MANPLSIGALTTFPFGAGAGTDRLTALPSATALGLGTINQSTLLPYDINIAPIRIKTGASGVSVSGYCRLWLVTSEDGTVWTDGVDPTTATNQASKLITAPLFGGISAAANATTYYFPEFSVASLLGFMPLYWAVVVENQSGAALDAVAASFYSRYLPIAYA